MKMVYVSIIALICALLLSSVSYAGTDLFSLEPAGTVVIDSNSVLKGVRTYAEDIRSGVGLADPTVTVTAAKTGITYVLKYDTYVSLTLPTAADGLTYTFVEAAQAPAGNAALSIIPQSADHIRYTTIATGETLVSAGATGNSLKLVGDADGYWTVTEVNGTWAVAS